MTLNGSTSLVMWIVNGLLAVVMALIGFTANREVARNDKQDERIMLLEKTAVKIDYMNDTLNKIERKFDRLSEIKFGVLDKNDNQP